MSGSYVRHRMLSEATDALLTHKWRDHDDSAHKAHLFDGACAVCRGDLPKLLPIALDAAEKAWRAASKEEERPLTMMEELYLIGRLPKDEERTAFAASWLRRHFPEDAAGNPDTAAEEET